MNIFYSPRSEDRAKHQLISWFGGKLSLDEQVNHKTRSKNRKDSTQDIFNVENIPRSQFLVSGIPSQICLIASPRFSSRYLGELLEIIHEQGFTVEGFKQMNLQDKTSSLYIPPQ